MAKELFYYTINYSFIDLVSKIVPKNDYSSLLNNNYFRFVLK